MSVIIKEKGWRVMCETIIVVYGNSQNVCILGFPMIHTFLISIPFDLPYMTCNARHIWQVDIDQPKPLM